MNTRLVQQLFGRISPRVRLIIVGVVAFLLGTMLGGRSGLNDNGRYVPWGERGLLDTRTGQIWMADDSHHFRRWASLPYF